MHGLSCAHIHIYIYVYVKVHASLELISPSAFRRAKTSHAIAQRGAVNTAGEMELGEHTTLPELPENIQIVFIFHKAGSG